MRTFRIFLIWIFSFLSIFLLHAEGVSAGCESWYSFASSCNAEPPYCPNGSCSIEKGNELITKVIPGLSTKKLSAYSQDIVVYLMGFISIIAVIYIIYAGFQVMTGGGDEEKMKKAKNIITYVIIGILIMWLAYSIVRWTTELITKTAFSQTKNSILANIIPEAQANPGIGTFSEYKNKLRIAIQSLESDFRVNGQVSNGSILNIKDLVQSAYNRLPDIGDAGTANDTARRAVDMYLDLALKNPTSSNHVSNAISKVATFIDSANISTVTGDISANPSEGNAPMTVSFRATNIKDPSGATPDSQNYTWWIRANGGQKELGRGPSLTTTFNQEGTFTVFLEVASSSRNSKGYTDVLPLSISKSIEVKPKLGEVVLMVNGVNVSNIPSLKISPSLAKMGIILDATASRAIGNGVITNTSWDFGNGNTMNYKGSPNIVERQIYSNQGTYNVKLELTANDGQKFIKEFQLIVRDPAAVISIDNDIAHVGEEVHITSVSYFTNNANIEYSWQIQDDNNKKLIKSSAGNKINYTFPTIGKYIVTLTARSPNNGIDTDSRVISIESREPIINLESPKSINTEKPNVIVFNAEKSYDPDTKSKKGLTFSWKLNGEKIQLDNSSENGAKGSYEFKTTGANTISLTVSNQYGKVSTIEKTFDVTSVLSANVLIAPEVSSVGSMVSFIAQSDSAQFFEWNFGDGTANINGAKKVVQHVFQKTGIYNVSLVVRGNNSADSNQIQRKVYITDGKNPMAIFDIKNVSSTVYEDSSICGDSGAYVINRSETTTLDASPSVNVDGSNTDLSYTWKYFGKIKTSSTVSEKFNDLGCFPIELTVRNNKNGATHTAIQYVYLKNQPPEITSISTDVDTSKKDSQKVLVKVNANGVQDTDGVVTSYIWYYTTESDKEPQNIQITQKNNITFVLPNITEKYYFGVILEDNDGARTNSMNEGTEQSPLILDNQNGNIYMPLISLNTPKSAVNVGEKIQLSVTAKTIVGIDITKQSEYAWDFDGDGKIDEKTNQPFIDHAYPKSGTYTIKVRASYNGVSNTKYQTIYVKNPLKATIKGFKDGNGEIYILNASSGNYNQATWTIGETISHNLYGIHIPQGTIGSGIIIGQLTITNSENDVQSSPILGSAITTIISHSGVEYQSFPQADNDKININEPSEKIILSFFGNKATRYEIDQNTNIDSDLDGIADNDIDNKNSPSYMDGSAYAISDFSINESAIRNIKINLFNGNTPIGSRNIEVHLNYITDTASTSGEVILLNTGGINTFDREKLDKLAELIRTVDDSDRVLLMKNYNNLVENWGDTFTKAKILIDLQEIVNEIEISSDVKTNFSETIDALLMGDAQSTDDITLSAKLIEGLIPPNNQNRELILTKLHEIQSHPQLLEKNRSLAKEILEAIKDDSTLEDKYKIHIRNQLLIIINGGQASTKVETPPIQQEKSSSGFFTFIKGFVSIFLVFLGILIVIVILAFIVFRMTRKNNDQGFQDFLIDRVFHGHTENQSITKPSTQASTNIDEVIVPNPPIIIPTDDPLKNYNLTSVDPLGSGVIEKKIVDNIPVSSEITGGNESDVNVPDWLKAATKAKIETTDNTVSTNDPLSAIMPLEANIAIPTTTNIEEVVESPIMNDISHDNDDKALNVPEGLKEDVQNEVPHIGEEIVTYSDLDSDSGDKPSDTLPDWLVNSVQSESGKAQETSLQENDPIAVVKKPQSKQKKGKKSASKDLSNKETTGGQASNDIPDWLK